MPKRNSGGPGAALIGSQERTDVGAPCRRAAGDRPGDMRAPSNCRLPAEPHKAMLQRYLPDLSGVSVNVREVSA
jgi:hypothetical protein